MITHQRLLEVLAYDPDTGIFRWKIPKQGRRKNTIAGSAGKPRMQKGRVIRPYWTITVEGKTYFRAKLAWYYVTGKYPSEIDHRDTDGFNDRFFNLREATRSLNNANRRAFKNNRSGCKGVHFRADVGKYRAMISKDRKNRCLGYFDTEEAASLAYRAAAKEAFGEFSRAA